MIGHKTEAIYRRYAIVDSAALKGILEAPPGFEPGMEVLQDGSADGFTNESSHLQRIREFRCC